MSNSVWFCVGGRWFLTKMYVITMVLKKVRLMQLHNNVSFFFVLAFYLGTKVLIGQHPKVYEMLLTNIM
jgi:hypothetical protein